MDFSFSLTHPVGCQGDQHGIVLEEIDNANSGNFHVEKLLIEGVELTLGLMNFHELQDDILVDIVSD